MIASYLSECAELFCFIMLFLVNTVNTLMPRENGHHSANIFKYILLNENVWIPIKLWLQFVPEGPISNIPALVQIMVWCRSAIVSLMTQICVIRPQLVKTDNVISVWNMGSLDVFTVVTRFRRTGTIGMRYVLHITCQVITGKPRYRQHFFPDICFFCVCYDIYVYIYIWKVNKKRKATESRDHS